MIDFVAAWRQIWRARALSLAVLCVLVLAIGLGGASLSLLNALVLRPLDVLRPTELVALAGAGAPGRPLLLPLATVRELENRLGSVAGLAGYTGGGLMRIEEHDATHSVVVEMADTAYFDLLGARPALGRLLRHDDIVSGASGAAVVVLSHHFWTRFYGADPEVLGRTLKVRGIPMTVVGVAEAGFSGLQVEAAPDIFLPVTFLKHLAGPDRPIRVERIVARLAHGVSPEAARAELAAFWPGIWTASGLVDATSADVPQIRLEPIATGLSLLRPRYARLLQLLVGLAVVMLVAAALSAGGLLLARQHARSRDLSLRMALGASRTRLIRQQAFESFLLAGTAALFALPVAWWASLALGRLLWTSSIPMTVSVAPDHRVVLSLGAAGLAIAALIALLPAISLRRREGTADFRARAMSRSDSRAGKVLLTGQVALSFVLLYGAILFTTSLFSLQTLDLGFRDDGVWFGRFLPRQPDGYAGINEAAYYPELQQRLEAIPGVSSVAFSQVFPNPVIAAQPISRAGGTTDAAAVSAAVDVVSPRFFETTGIALLAGRDFSWSDDHRSEAVAIVSSRLARELFPSGAIGQPLRIGADEATVARIVGVVTDPRLGNIREPAPLAVFRPSSQQPRSLRAPIVFLAAGRDGIGLAADVNRVLADLGREETSGLTAIGDHLARTLQPERLAAGLAAGLALIAMVLTAAGIFAVFRVQTVRRSKETGIRLALGASPARLQREVVRGGVAISIAGAVIGLMLALPAARYGQSLLFGLGWWAPWPALVTAGVLVIIGGFAVAGPARRAATMDPVKSLNTADF